MSYNCKKRKGKIKPAGIASRRLEERPKMALLNYYQRTN